MQRLKKVLASPRLTHGVKIFSDRYWPTPNACVVWLSESAPGLFAGTIRELSGVFSKDELGLILDAHNSVILHPAQAGQNLHNLVEDAIRLDGLDKKWKVDGKVVLEKITKLYLYHRAVIEIWAAGYWGNDKVKKVSVWTETLLDM